MKFTITLKDPNAEMSIKEAVDAYMEEHDEDVEDAMDAIWGAVGAYLEYGEYIRVEFDTEGGDPKVLLWK